MSGYLMESIRDNEDFKEAIRNVNYNQKVPKWQKGSFQGRRPIRDNEEFKEAVINVKNN